MFLENEETRKIKPIKLSNKTITKKPKEEDYNELEFNNLNVTEFKPWANQNEDDFNFINFESTNDIEIIDNLGKSDIKICTNTIIPEEIIQINNIEDKLNASFKADVQENNKKFHYKKYLGIKRNMSKDNISQNNIESYANKTLEKKTKLFISLKNTKLNLLFKKTKNFKYKQKNFKELKSFKKLNDSK